jgi:hypothetical protein
MTFQYSGTTEIIDYDENFKFIEVEDSRLCALSNGSSIFWLTTLNNIQSEVYCVFREDNNDVTFNVYQ